MAPKRKSQPRINASLFPEVERLIELVGKVIGVPGTEWGTGSGRVSAAEKATIFKCVLRDHTCVHKFPNIVSPEKAWQLQEMGVSGSGGLSTATRAARHFLAAQSNVSGDAANPTWSVSRFGVQHGGGNVVNNEPSPTRKRMRWSLMPLLRPARTESE
jgi:hypothetical protein